MKKIYYTWNDIESGCIEIARQLYRDSWKPDYIVGIARGGAIPATLLSHFLGVPMQTLDVSLRDSGVTVSNCGMSEDAFGYNKSPMNILVVDDINDSGDTINWIINDWQSSCVPNSDVWKKVWHQTVKFATLTNNLSSKATVDYSAWEINKFEDPVWIVFPWEQFWK